MSGCGNWWDELKNFGSTYLHVDGTTLKEKMDQIESGLPLDGEKGEGE